MVCIEHFGSLIVQYPRRRRRNIASTLVRNRRSLVFSHHPERLSIIMVQNGIGLHQQWQTYLRSFGENVPRPDVLVSPSNMKAKLERLAVVVFAFKTRTSGRGTSGRRGFRLPKRLAVVRFLAKIPVHVGEAVYQNYCTTSYVELQ